MFLMTQTTFQVAPRTDFGRKAQVLRRKNLVPGNVYGQGSSTPVVFAENDFLKLYAAAGETGLVYLQIEGEKKDKPVLIDEVQKNPVSSQVLHVTFKQVNLTEKITATVPVVMEGELSVHGTILVTVRDSIEVEALPTDFPENFTIDISTLTEIGQTITLEDLNYDKSKVTLLVGEEGLSQPVVMLQEQKEEVEETPDETEVTTEVIGSEEEEEGTTSASN